MVIMISRHIMCTVIVVVSMQWYFFSKTGCLRDTRLWGQRTQIGVNVSLKFTFKWYRVLKFIYISSVEVVSCGIFFSSLSILFSLSTRVRLRVCLAHDLRIVMYGSNHVVGHGYKDHMEKLEIMTGVFTESLKFDRSKIPQLIPWSKL